MAIMLHNRGYDAMPWYHALSKQLPAMEIRLFPEVGNRQEIEYALIWDHPHGDLASYPNLRAILLLGAGAEFLHGDPSLPDVPIVRLVDDAVARDMAQHSLHWVIHFHRRYDRYQRNQAVQRWERYDYPPTKECRVGILGMGAIGTQVAEELNRAGFTVKAWVRSARKQKGVELFTGPQELQPFLAETDILISLLPHTPDTESFLNAERLAMLPEGAFVINISRGSVIDDEALRSALDSGQIEAAALDVFPKEPLGKDSWHWRHPKVFVTPHASGNTYARSAAAILAANIRRVQRGEAPFPIYNPERGY